MKSKRKAKPPKTTSTTARSRRAATATTAAKPSKADPSATTTAQRPGSTAEGTRRTKAGKVSAPQRRALFIEAFLANGGNATQAAITAGFSEKTAKQQGSRLLTHADVRTALEARQQELQQKYALTTDRVLQELSRIALYDPRKLFNVDGSLKAVHELDDDTAAAIASVEVDEIKTEGAVLGHTRKLKAWDKNSALEKAMKTLGLFKADTLPPGQQPATVNVNVKIDPTEAYMRMVGK